MKISYKDGGEFDLVYDEVKHTYMVDENKIPSVTRVIDSCFPKYLTDWAVKEGADFFIQSIEPYRKPDPATLFLPYRVAEHIYEGILTASKAISEHAADIGNDVHNWIGEAIKYKLGQGEMPDMLEDEEAVNCINAFKKWARDNNPEWISTEEKVYYDDDENDPAKYSYAGTVDAVANVNGVVCVLDFKTSKKIYKPYHLQVAAYQLALRKMYGWKDSAKAIILRLDKETGEYQEKRFDPTGSIGTFFSCMDIRRWSSKRIPKIDWGFSEETKGPDT